VRAAHKQCTGWLSMRSPVSASVRAEWQVRAPTRSLGGGAPILPTVPRAPSSKACDGLVQHEFALPSVVNI